MRKIILLVLALFLFSQAEMDLVYGGSRMAYDSEKKGSKKSSRGSSRKEQDSAKTAYEKAHNNTNVNMIVSSLKALIAKYPQDQYAELAQFDIAKYYYMGGNFPIAVEEFTKFVQQYLNSNLIDKAYYYLGLSYVALADKDNANLCFDKIIFELGSKSSFLGRAYMSKGDMNYKLNEFELAMKYYKDAMANSTNGDFILSSLYYKMGRICQKQGKLEAAKENYNYVLANYPLSNEVVLIKDAMDEMQAKKSPEENSDYGDFSVQVGCFSSKENANKLKQKLAKKGYSVVVLPPENAKDKLFKVRVGKFSKKSDAEKMLNKLKTKEKIVGKIVP